MSIEAKKALKIGGGLSAAMLLLLTACGAKSNIKFEMTNCGDVRALELGPGDIIDLTDVDPKINFQIDDNGRVAPPPDADFGVLDAGAGWWFGDRSNPYYIVRDQGDFNNNGLTDILIQKICPVAPTPTISPSATPLSHAPIGSGKLASLQRGFASRGSKPAFNAQSVYRRG